MLFKIRFRAVRPSCILRAGPLPPSEHEREFELPALPTVHTAQHKARPDGDGRIHLGVWPRKGDVRKAGVVGALFSLQHGSVQSGDFRVTVSRRTVYRFFTSTVPLLMSEPVEPPASALQAWAVPGANFCIIIGWRYEAPTDGAGKHGAATTRAQTSVQYNVQLREVITRKHAFLSPSPLGVPLPRIRRHVGTRLGPRIV